MGGKTPPPFPTVSGEPLPGRLPENAQAARQMSIVVNCLFGQPVPIHSGSKNYGRRRVLNFVGKPLDEC